MLPKPAQPNLESYGLGGWRIVEGRNSVADLIPKKERCGLYVILFQNGELYVGQAVDIARRYTQHRKNHTDILALTWKSAPRHNLNAEETQLIHALEPLHQLRNLQSMSVVEGERDLDLILPPAIQRSFLTAPPPSQTCADMPPINWDANLSRRYQSRFDRFAALPYAAGAIDLLRNYALYTIPAPRLTELAFWTVSCLPRGSEADSRLLFRVSLNMQEVFSLFWDDCPQMFWATFHPAISPLAKLLGEEWADQLEQAGLEVGDHRYRAGGHDQCYLVAKGKAAIAASIEQLYPAMRLINLRLMRKGPCRYSQFHCPQMVNAALTPRPPSPPPASAK